jgi:hypothetical protein
MTKRQIVITLTAIPPRFSNLGAKFASIAKQSVRPDRVQLTLPQHYRRFPGERPALPPLPDWVEVHETEVDYGPATKILPAAQRWAGSATDLLVCDDDRLQDIDWVARFSRTRTHRPDDILCERGWNIEGRFGLSQTSPALPRARLSSGGGRTLAYRLRRALTLGLSHPPRAIYEAAGYVDVFEGFLGALIPVSAISNAAFDIPEVIWTVDDVWISGIAALNGTHVWVHDEARPVYADGRFDRIAALRHHVEQGIGRDGADRMGVEYLRQHHGVWK